MLKYVGGGRYIIGIPARDLEENEIKKLSITREELLKTDCYEEATETVKMPPRSIKGRRRA